jgi:hypothetical protein
MTTRHIAGAFVAGFVLAIPMAADWQYAKWGMNQAEVTAASHGKATKTTPKERTDKTYDAEIEEPLLKAPYESGRFNFTAYFHFDKRTQRLVAVSLDLRNVELRADLLRSLRQKYGKPDSSHVEVDVQQIISWRKSGDKIVFIQVGTGESTGLLVEVRYEPLESIDNRGL